MSEREWYNARDNDLTQEDLKAAIRLANQLASGFLRNAAGWIDEFEVQSQAVQGAWYAWSKYPRGATFDFLPSCNLTIRRFIHRALYNGKGTPNRLLPQSDEPVNQLTIDTPATVSLPEDELHIRSMVDRLPPTQREIILAQFYGWEKPVGVPVATESHRKKKALENLRRMWNGDEPLPEVLRPRKAKSNECIK